MPGQQGAQSSYHTGTDTLMAQASASQPMQDGYRSGRSGISRRPSQDLGLAPQTSSGAHLALCACRHGQSSCTSASTPLPALQHRAVTAPADHQLQPSCRCSDLLPALQRTNKAPLLCDLRL